ncbi:DNRLRE domain-containing protein [Paenibacillus sp. J5C_2022]|uniref:polysaccharide lyase family 8 super-sandwich domain-containing protein n=1 Tax=Paenibacillus sp. J5C2022 TaxID=2977129 RepID=UPI0021D3643A|nr:polysaccharide lyase family 8 super-sandwich domain-containing protein [Paenibacillus sp. J5C2022]MCU6712106.1 DNRLRE domain-containing protein [Paenibacillus sp. J5C2022]
MKRLKKSSCLLLLMCMISALLVPVSERTAYASDEYDLLRVKWTDYLTGGGGYNPADPDIAAAITAITDKASNAGGTGAWDTMDTSPGRTYLWSDLTSTTNSGHLTSNYSRLRDMAVAYSTVGSTLYQDTALESAIVGGLDWMYANRYNELTAKYGNNWHWDIGAPLVLGDVMALMYDSLSAAQIANYSAAVDHFTPGVGAVDTGANRLDKALILMLRGIVGKDSGKLTQARDAVSAALPDVSYSKWQANMAYGDRDGFYSDGSFIQHNYVPSTGSYGIGLLGGVTKLTMVLQGSTWTITDPNLSHVYDWVTEVFDPHIYRGLVMHGVMGRSIARSKIYRGPDMYVLRLSESASPAQAALFKSMVKYWIEADSTLANPYENRRISDIALLKSLTDDASISPRGDLTLHKQFSVMDRIVHLRPGFAFGVSMSSSRIYNYESINGENLKGWYTGEGMTYLYNNDLNQYTDAFWPTVNAYRLPGTTSDGATRSQGYASTKSWVGGSVIDREYGAAGMDLDPHNSSLSGKKSWFMFDDEIVALGAGITSTDNRDVETIVDNRMLNAAGDNTLTVDGTVRSGLLNWSESMSDARWAHLAGNAADSDIGYYFPQSPTVHGLREARTGSWQQIHSGGDSAPLTRNYLSLALNHGMNPTDASYSYVLLPNKSAAATSGYSADPDITIMANNAHVQAVHEKDAGVTAANFWSPGTVGPIRSSNPASVMIRENGNELTIAVSDPTMLQNEVAVELGRAGLCIESYDPEVSIKQFTPTIKLAVDTTQSWGKTYTVKFKYNPEVEVPLTETLLPAADAYVRGGVHGNNNYGSSSFAVIQDAVNPDYSRKTYLKFNLPDGAEIQSAKLRIHGRNATDTLPVTVKAYGTADNWTENGITWNNAPSAATAMLSSSGVDNIPAYHEFDVTEFVQGETEDGVVSFVLLSDGDEGEYLDFSTRESADNKPELVIVY